MGASPGSGYVFSNIGNNTLKEVAKALDISRSGIDKLSASGTGTGSSANERQNPSG